MLVNQGGDPIRRAALELNQELRKNNWNGAVPDNSGHVAFQIPELDFWYHTKFGGYNLLCSDPIEAKKELHRLLTNHPEYRVNKNEGKRGAPFKRGVVVR